MQLLGSPKSQDTLKSTLLLIFYIFKYSIKLHITTLWSSNKKMALSDTEQENMCRVWKRVCQETPKHNILLKNRVPSGLLLYVYLWVYTGIGVEGLPYTSGASVNSLSAYGNMEQMALITTNADNVWILLKATLSWF